MITDVRIEHLLVLNKQAARLWLLMLGGHLAKNFCWPLRAVGGLWLTSSKKLKLFILQPPGAELC